MGIKNWLTQRSYQTKPKAPGKKLAKNIKSAPVKNKRFAAATAEALNDLGISSTFRKTRKITNTKSRNRDLFKKLEKAAEEKKTRSNNHNLENAYTISDIAAKTQLTPSQIIEIYPMNDGSDDINVKAMLEDFDSGKGVEKIKDRRKKFDETGSVEDGVLTNNIDFEGHDPDSFAGRILMERAVKSQKIFQQGG